MSRRARLTLGMRAWLGAAAGSAAIHVVALLLLVGGGTAASPRRGWEPPAPIDPDWIDVVSLAEPEVAPPRAPEPPPEPAPRATAEGDQNRPRADSVAPRPAEGDDPRAPAPDDGTRAGRVTDGSWRRDRSTLQARLTDGASVAQSPRLDSGARSASPQAVRREPVVGAGDATRTEVPESAPSAAQPAIPEEPAAAERSRSAAGTPSDAPVTTALEPPGDDDRASTTRGLGPLDVERAPRSFDSAARGAPVDDRDQRAASNETRPGATDFSRAGVRAPTSALSGLGPGDAPGAVDRASAGSAPAVYGALHPQLAGDQASEPTRDRRYVLYLSELTRRVNNLRKFPKQLALHLEQGATVVRFVVEADGRVRNGVQIMKSSGFDEFDREAARAVERAAPFPPVPPPFSAHPLPISMCVTFENPLVR